MATTLTVRLDDDLHQELARIAEGQGVTLSDLTRRTLGALVRSDDEDSSELAGVPATLPNLDRLQLALLYRILAKLVDGSGAEGSSDDQVRLAEILERGYVGEYDEVFVAVRPELSRRETELVEDIFEMFTYLGLSYDKLAPLERESLADLVKSLVRFQGFDANHRLESRLLTYARHLINDGKWERLAVHFDKEHERGNSHMPRIDVYKRMLAEFHPIWRAKLRSAVGGPSGHLLTLDEIKRVADAAIHPENRR